MDETIIVDENKLDALLDVVQDECLCCPPPMDFNNEAYAEQRCPAFDNPNMTCQRCWKNYLETPSEPEVPFGFVYVD